jgi:VWFA-related protein
MNFALKRALLVATAVLACPAVALLAAQSSNQPPSAPAATTQSPVFRAGTERIVIDATVVAKDGTPVSDLGVSDFTLTIDGQPRPLLSAEFIKLSGGAAPAPAIPSRRFTGFSTNRVTAVKGNGRLVLLAFDVDGISTGGGREVVSALGPFLETLPASDRIGVSSVPNGPSVDFTTDRAAITKTLSRVVGHGLQMPPTGFSIGTTEAFEIDSGNPFALNRVVERECIGGRREPEQWQACRNGVANDAREIARIYRQRAVDVSHTLQNLLRAFRTIDAPKILIWITEGLPLQEGQGEMVMFSADAAAARTTIYVLQLDRMRVADASVRHNSPSAGQDRLAARRGLDLMAGATRGTVLSATDSGATALARIGREISGYYLLGAEPRPEDHDGRRHKIALSVARPDVTIRARRDLIVPAPVATADLDRRLPADKAIAAVLRTSALATDVPLKATTYALGQTASNKLRVLVCSELDRTSTAPENATVGFAVVAADGTVAASGYRETKLEPLRPGEPTPLTATTVVELEPGDYRLKLAVIDGEGRRGSVEHPFTASLARAEDTTVADLLLVPHSDDTTGALRVTADPALGREPFDAYLEMYGRAAARPPQVTFEVRDDEQAPPLTQIRAQVAGGADAARMTAEAAVPVSLLPPGEYVATATVTVGTATVTRAKPFRIVEPSGAKGAFDAALAARAAGFSVDRVLVPTLVTHAVTRALALGGAPASPAARTLADQLKAGKLDALDKAQIPATDQSLAASFLSGLIALKAARLEQAAAAFRAAVRSSPDFLDGIFYLGACYAAGGRIDEALGAWQASLAGDDVAPDVYMLVADALVKSGDLAGAKDVLAEAGGKWPNEPRIAVARALARAADGDAAGALDRLTPLVDAPQPDPEVMRVAVQLALAALVESPEPERVGAFVRVRALHGRLTASGAPPLPLVARWAAYLGVSDSQ